MSNKSTHIPSTAELVEAVTEFLESKLLPTLEGSQKFNTRVSINALKIVQRELQSESLPEAELLELAEQIRNGEFWEDDPALLQRLRQQTLQRLAIDNPRYSSYLAATED